MEMEVYVVVLSMRKRTYHFACQSDRDFKDILWEQMVMGLNLRSWLKELMKLIKLLAATK